MAGKTKSMSQIKQLLQLHQQGYRIKTIARSIQMSKNTVKAYLQKISMMPMGIEKLLTLEDPELDAKLHAGNPAYKENRRYDYLKSNLNYYERELQRTGVTKKVALGRISRYLSGWVWVYPILFSPQPTSFDTETITGT
jgi:hypothetical protein